MKLKTMLKTLFCCAGMAAPFLSACAATPGPHQFEAGDKAFLLDGKPFLVRRASCTIRASRARTGTTASR